MGMGIGTGIGTGLGHGEGEWASIKSSSPLSSLLEPEGVSGKPLFLLMFLKKF
jgi:hypothetical protein